jgi:putative transposase
MDQWAYLNGVTLNFSRPGKPTDNGLIEAFNGRLRAECLADARVRDEHWFLTLGDAQAELDAWRDDYNSQRPHGALKNMTPDEFAQRAERGHPPGGDRGPHYTATTARQRRPEPCPTG